MSDITRYSPDGKVCYPDLRGRFVTYADHVEALRQARAETRYANALVNEQAKRDALAAAVQRVEALPRSDIGPDLKLITAKMVKRDNGQYVDLLAVIAAIKGDSGTHGTTRADEERRQALEKGEMA